MQLSRVHWVDALRGIAIFMMIMVHLYNSWAEVSISNSSSLPLYVYLLGMAPAFFLAVVGMSMFLSLRRRGTSLYHLKRGAWLFIGGFSLGMATIQPQIFGIFQIIGFSIILIDLFHRLNLSSRGYLINVIVVFILTIAVNLLSPNTSSEYFFSISKPYAYTRFDLVSYSSDIPFYIFIENMLLARVSYPILPWVSFALLGYILAKFLLENDSSNRRSIACLGMGILLVILSISFMAIGFPIYKYPTTLNYVVLSSGVFVISTALIKMVYDLHTSAKRNSISKSVEYVGQYAFEIFILQYYVIAVGAAFISLEYSLLVVAMISSCIFLLVAVMISNAYGNDILVKFGFFRFTGVLRKYSLYLTISSFIVLASIFYYQNELFLITGNVAFYLISRGSSFVSILLVYWQIMLGRNTPLEPFSENQQIGRAHV